VSDDGITYEKVRVYGDSAALVVEAVQARATRAYPSGAPTLNIEGAPCTAREHGRGVYDWASKITVQVAERELVELVAVAHGWVGIAEGTYHMGGRDRVARGWRAQQDAAGRLRIAVFQPGASHTVAFELHDRLELAMLSMRRLALRYPGTSTGLLYTTLRTMIESAKSCTHGQR